MFFLRPEPARTEVLNDINGELVNLYRVVQHHFDEFVRQFDCVLTARDTFALCQATPAGCLTDIQRAARFFFLQHTAFGGKSSISARPPPAARLMRPMYAIRFRRLRNGWAGCISSMSGGRTV